MKSTHEEDQTDQHGLYQEKQQQLIMMKSTHEEDQTDQQGLYQGKRETVLIACTQYTFG